MTTPLESYPKLAAALGVKTILFKRDDLHMYGSHKGRSIPFMIDFYWNEGKRKFAISSSGNAALAAALYAQKKNSERPTWPLSLQIFVGKKINLKKLEMLHEVIDDPRITIEQVDRPLQRLFEMSKDHEIQVLRQSTDDGALLGYDSLGDELNEVEYGAVFIPTSSGTTAQALFEFFSRYDKTPPQIHIVQTDAVHPMIDEPNHVVNLQQDESLANAIVDTVAYRKDRVQQSVKKSGGDGWIATNSDIENAVRMVRENTGVTISPNSALAVVGVQKAVSAGQKFESPIVCLITGQ